MNKNYLLFAVLMISMSFSSCKKDKDVNAIVEIDETDITQCQQDSQCEYLFTEHADINLSYEHPFKVGSNRVFWTRWVGPIVTTSIYVKAPMTGTSFSLTKKDILESRVGASRSCVTCNMVAMHAVDGYAKGRNLTPDKPADQTKWIVEAKIILEEFPSAAGVSRPLIRDTVSVKQYFYPNLFITDP